jgi:hypothetical protein
MGVCGTRIGQVCCLAEPLVNGVKTVRASARMRTEAHPTSKAGGDPIRDADAVAKVGRPTSCYGFKRPEPLVQRLRGFWLCCR